jgi:ATP phosphoribosyltransferase
MSLKLGIPSKGRLQQDAVEWFAARGIVLERTGSDREYAGRVRGVAGVDLVLLSAAEIPGELARGRLHLGITGQDLVRERFPRWPALAAELAPLGFGRADLVVAVPSVWIDVADMADLDAAAADFRETHGFRLRVATKYHHLVRDFFRGHGVADYQLVDSQGATEGTVKNHTAEIIADITSTGSTLRDNHLKVLADGLILESQATVFAARAADWTGRARRAYAALSERLDLAALPAPEAGGFHTAS